MNIQEIIESIIYSFTCNNDSIPITQDDLQTIIETLEKQIPCKPYNFSLESYKGGCVPVCGKCNGIMGLMQGELNYCPNCGQKIEWSDVK